MNKKLGERFGIFAFLTLLSTSFVSAIGPIDGLRDLLYWISEIIIILLDFLSPILGNASFDEFLFAKVLLFTIVLMITYAVLKKNNLFGRNKPALKVISIAVALLSIRFLEEELIDSILLPYSALGVALTTFLPFMIYFFFIHQSDIGPFGRIFGWVIFALSFSAILGFRSSELTEVASYIYGGALLFIVISLIFDKSIHSYFQLSDLRGARREGNARRYAEIEERIERLDRNMTNTSSESVKRSLERQKERLNEELERLSRKL